MNSIINLCFLCTTNYDCMSVNEKILSQVEYLLPEITIIKLGVPLRICSVCDGALCAFSKFKQSSVESSRRLEASIKGAQGPQLHTGSPPVVDDNDTSGAKPEKVEEIFIKEEYLEETPLDSQMHTDRAIDLLEAVSAEPYNQLQNMQPHTDINAGNIEEIFIKEEQIEETSLNRELYSNVLKEEFVSDSMNDDTDSQPRHNTEDESAIFNITEKNWEEEEQETDGNCTKNIQTGTKKTKHTINQDQIKNIQLHSEQRRSEKKFQCEICNKLFIRKEHLIRHTKIHSGVKDFQCEICTKLFVQKAGLIRHKKVHTGVKDFQCDICKKLFATKPGLNYHMNLHSRVKHFQCEICKKLFTASSSLNDHMKIHLGLKHFQCDICEKSFILRSTLIRHMRIHSGVKDFQCEICDKLFTRKENLSFHMKIHS